MPSHCASSRRSCCEPQGLPITGAWQWDNCDLDDIRFLSREPVCHVVSFMPPKHARIRQFTASVTVAGYGPSGDGQRKSACSECGVPKSAFGSMSIDVPTERHACLRRLNHR